LGVLAPPNFDPTLNLDIGAINIPIEIDSRDHEQFPRDGWLVNAKGLFYRKSLGGDFDAETFKLLVNRYLPMRDRDVLALRLMAKGTSEDTPFFLLSSFGGSKDLRGYPSGRYRDRMMYAIQSEYRWQYSDSWIFTGFAGFGEVADSFSDFGRNILPAAGFGARYVLSKKHRVSLSADIAVGDDGAEFYFGVGEAF
jgi:outer membrane protein assembly factor BamA